MPYKSRWQFDIPNCSLPTLVFGSPTAPLDDTKPLYIDVDGPGDTYLTKQGYRLLCQRFALGLRKQGFKDGDRLLLYSGNNIYFPSVILGTAMAGGIFTGANPNYVAREVAFQLQDSGAKFLLCTSTSLDVGLAAAEECNFPRENIFYFDKSPKGGAVKNGCKHWSTLLASESEGRQYAWNPLDKPGENERTVALNYSSGTTGRPKGVEITHRNYVANCMTQRFITESAEDAEEKLKTAKALCFLPFYHAYGQTIFGVTNAILGIPTHVMSKFDFIKMLDVIEKFGITDLNLVPPIVVAMAKHPDVKRGKWNLSSIRSAGAGAAPLGRAACEEFEGLFNDRSEEQRINVHQGWGMTEGTCTFTITLPGSSVTTAHVGELGPNNEAKFMREDGSGEAPRGERGEIWIRGPTVMKGYWQNEKATKETLMPDGYLRTGDIAYMNENGEIYIVDRMKELIKVKSNQVAPAELEALLLEHPAVTDAAVIGIPNDGDEAPRAYIVRTAGEKASGDEIASFLASKVTRYKRLTGGVRFIDAIPKNPSGKILRRQLRELAAKDDKVSAKL